MEGSCPGVSEFYGIVIQMSHREHRIAHFHANYGDDEAVVGIDPNRVLSGRFPGRAQRLVFEWAALHQDELADNWDRAKAREPLRRIDPLDDRVPRGARAMEKATVVTVIPPYVIEVTFRGGTRRRIDMEPELWGEVFEPLLDPSVLAQAAVDPIFGSVSWPTGADLAPEFLYYGHEGPPQGYYEPSDEPAAVTTGGADRR